MCFQIIVITLVFILFGFYIIQTSNKTNSSLHPLNQRNIPSEMKASNANYSV